MLKVWTAQYRYPGPHRLDITVKGKDPVGLAFAPNWGIVKAYKETGDEKTYTTEYHRLMTKSYDYNRDSWDQLLAREQVVLVCFCAAGAFCHRHLLAYYLELLGAQKMGEITNFTAFPKEEEAITSFDGDYRWLSNFWFSPFTHEGIFYRSNEHFYQAHKFPPEFRAYVGNCEKPKMEGRKAVLPPHWDDYVKNDVMRLGLRLKFQNIELRDKLLATGNRELIEGNYWHDNYWGDCTCPKCINTPGFNMLGQMLMELRSELR